MAAEIIFRFSKSRPLEIRRVAEFHVAIHLNFSAARRSLAYSYFIFGKLTDHTWTIAELVKRLSETI